MGVSLSSGTRYRHVVFTTAAPRPPLNLGSVPRAAAAPGVAKASDATGDDDAFISYLFSRAGLNARNYRPTTLRRRVPACLRALRVQTVSQGRRLLQRSPSHVPAALGAMLIGVTGFFRDADVFRLLTRHVGPALADPAGRLRVWSAGCSDGAELYSVAMLLAEFGGLPRCELLGTDCRQEAVIRAAAGRYEVGACAGVPADVLARYFTGETGGAASPIRAAPLAIVPGIRERVVWRTGDVLAEPEPGPWDLVLCRNLAMYLRPHAAERLWHQFAGALRPGGLLVVGKAERPTGAAARAFTALAPCIYRRGAVA